MYKSDFEIKREICEIGRRVYQNGYCAANDGNISVKIDDNTYACLIYYNKNMETELLIETLSFGPMVEVVGNSYFLEQVKARLRKQRDKR